MKNPIHLKSVTLLTSMALAVSAHGQLFQDDFESYAPGTIFDNTGNWATVGVGDASVLVFDEATDTPFGTPNRYLDFNDDSLTASVRLQSGDLTAASGAVTTFSFDFNEPSSGGAGNMIFGYAITGGDLNNTGQRISMSLDDGVVTGLSTTAENSYSLDSPYTVFVVFNDTASVVDYTGGSVAPGVADVWLRPSGGALVYAGSRNTFNTQTASYRVGLRSFSTNLQQVSVDNIALYEGVALPGVPALVETSPADGETDVAVATNLVATFSRAIAPGTGNITVKQTVGNGVVATLDVTNPAEVVFSGSTMTIDLPSDLALSTGYYVEIDATAIQSVFGDAFPGITGNSEWNFTTSADSTPPSLLTTTPVAGATDVAIDALLVVNFDEAVTAGTGSIVISNLTEATTFATIDISDTTQVTFDGTTLTIDPTDDLHAGRIYAVEIDAGAVTDTTGNPFVGISGTTEWDFDTVADVTNPVLTSTTPADNAAAASLTNNLVATFDEAILAGSGDITILNLTDSTTFATIPVGDAQVLIDANTLTIDFLDALEPAKDYAVQIAATAVTDLSGNSFAGIVSPDVTTWNFKTTALSSKDSIVGESEAGDPLLLDYLVDSNSNVIGLGGAGGERTDRNMVLGYVLPTLQVGEVPGSVNFFFEITSARNTSTVDPLPELQVYLLNTADPDASGTEFFFHGFSDGSPNVAVVGVTSVTVTGTNDNNFGDDSQDRVFTLTGDALALLHSFYGDDHIPDQPEVFFRFGLDSDPAIDSYIRYRVDLGDNESGLEIESVATTPPVITSTSPADDAVNVYEGTSLVATFDRNIVADSGALTIWNITDNSLFDIIDVNDEFQASISGPTLTITPDLKLDPAKEYAIQIDDGMLVDAIGNPFVGIALDDFTTWSFTTGTSVVGANSGEARIIGRAQSQSTTAPGYYSGGDGRIGIGGGTNARQDQNKILIFTLPTLPVGSTLGAAGLNFQIESAQNHSGADPQLEAYLLDSSDPSSTGTTLFYHGPGDTNPDVARIGGTNTSHPQGTAIPFDPPQQENFMLSGDALALLQSFYGGDHIPDQAEVYIRFNLDNFVNDRGNADVDLNGLTFDRYFIGDEISESSLDIVPAPGGAGGGTFADWISGFNVGGMTGVDDDPDRDGNDNGVENFFGTAPDKASRGLVSGLVTGGTFTFTHPQSSTPASDLTAAYVWSKDLITPFNAAGTTDGEGTKVDFTTQANTPSAGMTTVTATVTGTATDRLFIRVEVD